MSGFSGSPRLMKGALVLLEGQQDVRRVIPFQYNPESVQRSLRARYQYRDDDVYGGQPLGLKGPPIESIRLTVELDATDALEQGSPIAIAAGILPALSALESLLYPDSEGVIAEETLAQTGAREIVPAPLPLTLLVWGAKRVVPVRISDIDIEEQTFDPDLNPLTARVAISLEVLTYRDLGGIRTVGGALSLARHVATEVLAETHTANGAADGVGAAVQSLPALLAGFTRR